MFSHEFINFVLWLQILKSTRPFLWWIWYDTVKPVLSGHSKIDKTKILMTNGSLMKLKSIAECSPWSILQYFWPALNDNWSWKPIFGLFEGGHFRQVLIYEPQHESSNNVVCATSQASDQPAHMGSLIRTFANRLNILWVLSYWLNNIWSV